MSRRKRDKRQSMRGAAAPAPPSTSADGTREVGRFSARRKTETILRLLRGESLDGLARELGVTAATLAGWREAFLAGGQGALKSRLPDERDDEIQRLRAKVGEITMNNELLLERCHRVEANLPLPRRRPSE
jgi:transposase